MIERAVILTDGGLLRIPAGALGDDLSALSAENISEESANRISAQERLLIEQALARSNGRVSGKQGAASQLGLSASTLNPKFAASASISTAFSSAAGSTQLSLRPRIYSQKYQEGIV